jgi:anti-sigma factor RsiW
MNAMQPQPDCPDEAARLLPWFVNGTLPAADRPFVEAHLARCETCRGDAAALAQMRTLLRSPGQVEHAPHAGLRKLMQRIDTAVALPQAADVPTAAATEAAHAAQPPAGRAPRHRTVAWLAGAVVLQSLALLFVAVGAWRGSGPADAAPYRTLTAPPPPPAPPALRVVFAPSTTVAEVQEMLRAHGLAAQSGPSEAGLFTLVLRAPRAPDVEQAAALARLRADPRVHFAESVRPGDVRP